jgi:hypothetical protein
MQSTDPADDKGPTQPFGYATPPPRARGAWVRLPKDPSRLRALLPAYVCCQCMSEGYTRAYRRHLPVPLCPTCRSAWRRRERLVTVACIATVAIAALTGTALVAIRHAALGWTDLATAAAGITGASAFLVFPVIYFFASPVIVLKGKNEELMSVRFPNREYVRMIQFKGD